MLRPWLLTLAIGWGGGLAAVGALGGCKAGYTDADIRNVELAEVRALTLRQERSPDERIVVMIDARSSSRFAQGHIPGARNIHLPQLPSRGRKDPELDSYRHLIVYGDNPATPSARGMSKRLMSFGYDGVRMFGGGMSAWRRAGYPVATETPEAETPEAESPEETEAGEEHGQPGEPEREQGDEQDND